YSDAGRFREAAETLDRAAELDPYESGHAKRLETLRGRIDEKLYSRVANRFQKEIKQGKARAGQPVPSGAAPSAPEAAAAPAISGEAQAHVLEDLILQAELYMQYGMKAKALEGVERIHKQFPREELKNEKLRHLYASAGFTPHYKADAPAIPAQPPAAAANNRAVSAPDGGTSVDSFARVTDITRNIYRQASVKSVLFTAVNEIGRHFGASRCVAGLCTPGKPPSAALEFCAPGIKQSDVMSIVKLIAVGQQLAANGAVTIPNAQKAPELASAKEHVEALSIQSMVAVPLLDSGEQSGILILEQITPRQWQSTDLELLNTLAEQVVQAVANARLRSLMKTLAVTDEKSGLLKRSSYLDVLLSEVKRSLQQQTPLTLLLLHFGKASVLVKEVGQSQVENMMQQIGQSLASHIRQNDVAVRYDLTTIALLLSDTGEKNAFLVVEKMRK